MDDYPSRTRRTVRFDKSLRREHRSPRRREYSPNRRRRYSPDGCAPCMRDDYRDHSNPNIYTDTSSFPSCTERCCFPGPTDSFLDSIRNGFQKIFSTRKRTGGDSGCKNKLYVYSMSQLKCLDQLLGKLESETCCIEGIIKEATDCDCSIDCNELRCSLNVISDRTEGIKLDLSCAIECYDPCRDKCEYDLICHLMDRACCLETLISSLCLQLDCLESRFNRRAALCEPNCCVGSSCKPDFRKPCCDTCSPPSYRKPFSSSPCRLGCRKPCCTRTGPCGDGCRKPCCAQPCCEVNCDKGCCKPKWGPRKMFGGRGLFRTSSVIPVGVMLVKL